MERAVLRRGGDEQRPPPVLRQLLHAAPERGLDPGAGAEGGGERLAALELGVGEQRRHLEQRERVAAGARHEPLGHRQRDPGALRALEQRARLRGPQRADLQPLEPGPDRDRPAAVGAEQDDPLGAEPAAGEQQRLERAVVEPLAVVDERQQRLLLGGRGEQAQHARHDGVAIAARRLAERERPAQRGGLGRRDRVEPVEQRPEQLAQARERDVRLGLHPARAQDRHAGALRPGARVLEQRGLADPGLADEQQRAAPAGAGVAQQPVDPGPLLVAADEHHRCNVLRAAFRATSGSVPGAAGPDRRPRAARRRWRPPAGRACRPSSAPRPPRRGRPG